jgi:hypothetical protein
MAPKLIPAEQDLADAAVLEEAARIMRRVRGGLGTAVAVIDDTARQLRERAAAQAPEVGQRIEFTADGRMRTGNVLRIFGTKAVNITIKTDDEETPQTYVRLRRDVQVIPAKSDPR